VGNAENAAALEMTLAGGCFEFESGAVIALTGADFETGIPMWTAVEVKPGEQIRCGHARSGARCYLCVRGGIDVPLVLGSASTHILTGLGGYHGGPLKRGAVLMARTADADHASNTRARRAASPPLGTTGGPIRVTAASSAHQLCGCAWEVRPDSNRMGLRLRGPALDSPAGDMLTEGVPLGAIQLPPDGQPIVLFVEHQTTGGYRKIANVISADFHGLGQLRAGDRVRFEEVSMDAALALLEAQEEWLHSLA